MSTFLMIVAATVVLSVTHYLAYAQGHQAGRRMMSDFFKGGE